MFFTDALAPALALVMQWPVLTAIALGTGLGILVGAMPGLTTVTAMAIVLPVSFFLEPLVGIPFLIGIYKGGIFGGSIPAILIATPGTGASVATTFDGPSLVANGEGRKAMDMALYASVFGDTVSDIATLVLIVPIAALALLAGPPELAALMLLAIMLSISAGSAHWTRGVIMACLGILLATIGRDPIMFAPRLTFDLALLEDGVPLLPMLVGLFAIPEIARLIGGNSTQNSAHAMRRLDTGPALKLGEFKQVLRTIVRSTGVGTLLGVLPGVGQPIAAFMGYSLAKRFSRTPQRFGRGALEGVAAAEAANNAVNGPTLVPLLTLGIPGDKITAVLLGAFVAQGLRPGPQLLQDHAVTILAMLLAMLLANVFLFVIARALIPLLSRLVTLRRYLLAPAILVLAMTGAYLFRSQPQDIYFMGIFGLLGIAARRYGFDVAPLVLAFILCESLEYAAGQSVNLARNDVLEYFLFQHPGALIILLLGAGLLWAIFHLTRLRSVRQDR